MLPESWQNVRRVLAIQLGSLNDVKLTTPALRQLRRLLPDVAIVLMTSSDGSQLATEMPWVNEVLACTDTGVELYHNAALQALISRFSRSSFDAAVIFTNGQESPYPLAYVCYLAGIPIRIGQSQEFGGSVLSQWVKLQLNTNPIDQHIFLINSALPSGHSST